MEDGEDLAGDFGGSNDVMTAEENDSMQGKQEWSRRYIHTLCHLDIIQNITCRRGGRMEEPFSCSSV